MSKRLNHMINVLQIQLAEQKNAYAQERNRADAAADAARKQAATFNQQYAQIQAENRAASAAAQAGFAEQLAATRDASAQTVAGLEQLLVDQQNQNALQQKQFAEQQAIAQTRYEEQMARSSRLQSAYVPSNQPTAGAPLVGDQRTAYTPTPPRRRTLQNLSIVNRPGAGGGTNSVSGLQIA